MKLCLVVGLEFGFIASLQVPGQSNVEQRVRLPSPALRRIEAAVVDRRLEIGGGPCTRVVPTSNWRRLVFLGAISRLDYIKASQNPTRIFLVNGNTSKHGVRVIRS